MEIVLSVAFGVWISVTALVYRAFTAGDRRKDNGR